jgi:glycosyltransferase involved in cell wall biosynthesis
MDADVVHAHSYGYFQTNLLSLLRRLRGTPSVITAHFHPETSMWGGRPRVVMRRLYDRTFGERALNGVDIVISHTRNEVELMKEVGLDTSGGRVRLVPAGIDFSKFAEVPGGAAFRKHYSIPDGERIVLFSGRLAVNKGLLVLAEAAPAVLKQFPDTRFVLVGGDMGAREHLERKLDELRIRKKFLLTGHIKDDVLFRSAYGACDVFVLPSEYEAFGLVLLEALASERPCVAAAVGGMPEVLGRKDQSAGDTECGILSDYGDGEALAGALNRLLGDAELRRKMGAAGRKRVRERFTWDHVTDKLLKIYTELTG